jgi:hypothetical protein
VPDAGHIVLQTHPEYLPENTRLESDMTPACSDDGVPTTSSSPRNVHSLPHTLDEGRQTVVTEVEQSAIDAPSSGGSIELF